jgi:ferredoxin
MTVTFEFSGESHAWDAADENLLQFAEKHGIEISSGCTYGDCGTCLTDIIAGEVEYLHPTGAQPDAGTCLPCSCKPATDLVLRA